MNFRALLSILGLLLILVSAFLYIFAAIAWLVYPLERQMNAFVLSGCIALSSGILLRTLGGRARESQVSFREALAIAGLGWIVIAVFCALPFVFSKDIVSFTDAYFESMSGLTTTGASILTKISPLGHTILLWRSFLQWLGGMGIIVLSIALLPALGIGGMQLYKAEVPGPSPDKLVPRVGQTARLLYFVYTFLSVAQFLLLIIVGMPVFEALCHTFTTMSTGGFSPLNASIGEYSLKQHPNALYIEIIIIIFMFLASLNFSLHFKFLKGKLTTYFKDAEFRGYIIILLFSIVTITYYLYAENKYATIGESLRHSAFAVVSIMTTTGFATEDFNIWPAYAKILLVSLMFIGGCAGSTSGGIKVIRIMTLLREAISGIARTAHPKKIYTIRFSSLHIPKDIVESMNSFVILFFFLYFFGVLILATTGLDSETIGTAVVSCLSNVGPGLSKIGPMENFALLPDYAKWILAYLMVLGRLELYALLALFVPRIWSK